VIPPGDEVVAVQPSGDDDQLAGCFEGAESGGVGADSAGQWGLAGLEDEDVMRAAWQR